MPHAGLCPEHHARERRAWGWAILLQAPVVFLELYYAPRTDSWTLWVDMVHNINDVLLIALSGWPCWSSFILRRVVDPGQETRWRRIAERVNITMLMLSGLAASISGYLRFSGLPVDVHFGEALPVAITSGVINTVIYYVIRPFRSHGHVEILTWHQFWDVMTSMVAIALLWAGSRIHVSQLDAVAAMIIGVAMFLHWPLHQLLERNGHTHHH